MTDTPTVKDVDSLQTTIKNLQNLQNSSLFQSIKNLQASPVMNAMMNLQNSPFMVAARNLQTSPIMNLARNLQNSPLIAATRDLQKSMIPISNFVQQIAKLNTTIDLSVFRKIYHQSMIRELNAVKDERITAILGQVLTEYWLNIFIQNLFSNHSEIQRMSFDNKRKILFGLGVINSNLNNDLKRLDDVRAEYAHNFVTDKKKILGHLEKMNAYRELVGQKK
ncbi:MAG: hypothetical protein EB149_07440, partial [Thaumarchaeota archaeon]|nr:hypothetical protein [Nitrososphaerota archaeon]